MGKTIASPRPRRSSIYRHAHGTVYQVGRLHLVWTPTEWAISWWPESWVWRWRVWLGVHRAWPWVYVGSARRG